MVDRIKKVMEYYEFTPSDFADALGVSRSNLTHVFSGRNQPSLDFARRVLMAFPEISSEWLIMGVGEMIKPAGSEPEAPKKSYVQTDLFASAEEELGWGESHENNEELGMRSEMSDVRSQMSEGESGEGDRSSEELGMRSEMSDVRSQMSEGESGEGNRSSEELGMRGEKSDVRGQMSEGESGEGNRSSEELGMRGEKSDVRSQMSEGESVRGNGSSEELGVRSEMSDVRSQKSDVRSQMSEVRSEGEDENRNVNSAQTDGTFVNNDANFTIQPQQQKILSNEKTPKMDTKQADTKIVRQRRPLPSSSSESKIQHHPTAGSRIYDSREPISASEKKVVKIIFFYDDDSFKIYHP